MNILSVSNLHKQINPFFAVRDVSFVQQPLQQIAIVGETGSGKSTLLKMIAGLIQPDGGSIYFEDIKIKGPDEQLIAGHPAIAYLSQHYELRNNYRMEELLEYASKLSSKQAAELYRLCRIDHLMQRKTGQLSGG